MASAGALRHGSLLPRHLQEQLTGSAQTRLCSSCICSSRSYGGGGFDSNSSLVKLFAVNTKSSGRNTQMVGLRAMGVDSGRIGSRRRKKGQERRRDELPVAEVQEHKEPYLEPRLRKYREEGHELLDDAEDLLSRADNSFALVLDIAADANEYFRNNKEESLRRKPILKVISDRINDVYGKQIRDSYIGVIPDYSEFLEE